MNEVLLFFILKYKGNWMKIYQALESREKIEIEELLKVNSRIECGFISIVKEEYPQVLKKIYKPPFGLFVLGNIKNLEMEKITLIGNFKYNDVLPILMQEKKYALVMKINENNYEKIKDFAQRGVRLILICDKGIKKQLEGNQDIFNFKNILLISEYYYLSRNKLEIQPFQRILMGLSSNTIINYEPAITDINLVFEIAKQEDLNLYNFKNCPNSVLKKYNIKKIKDLEIYANFKN